jgi:2-aminoadipate transaminase
MVGSGYFARPERSMPVQWERLYAERTRRIHGSEIRALLKITAQPDIISLAGGMPAPEAFPIEEFRAAFDRVLEKQGKVALQYGMSEGYTPLREFLAQRLARFGTRCGPENILITQGSQQGLDLVAKVFLNPGDKVLVENPTYAGALQAFNVYEAQYVVVPQDDDGMVTEGLDEIMARERPKFVYALPNFQNPTGRTMSLERRRQLVAAATRHGVPIVEDDPYGELRYEGADLPSLKSMDTDEVVIGLGSFSKILAPVLRLAWMVLPEHLFDMILFCKQPADLHSSMVVQMGVYELCKDGFADRHIEVVRSVYRERQRAMLDALATYFPKSVRYTKAEGGLFVWAELPPSIDARELLVLAVLKKVAFVPGQSFHADGSGKNTMRLNFSNVTPERLRTGVERLGRVIEQWTPLHSFGAGLAIKIGPERLERLAKPFKGRSKTPVAAH